MNDLDFILHLRALGIKLMLDGDSVRFKAPRGVLTDELRAEMKRRKDVIRDFLQRTLSDEDAASTQALSRITPADRNQPLPLSYAQQRLWLLHQMEPNTHTYNQPSALRLAGHLDVDALERSIRAMIHRHEALRTTFAAEGKEPRQVVHREIPFEIPIIDLRGLPVDERESRLSAEIAAESRSPFDLQRGPLMRARLFQLAHDEHVLMFTAHHIVSDAWSIGVFVREFVALYDAFARGAASPLPPLELHYADYAVWQRRWLEGGELEQQLAYWRNKLEGMPGALELPADRPRPDKLSLAGAALFVTIPRQRMDALNALCQQQCVTLFMVFLAAFEILLSRYTGQDDIVVGTPIANRTHADTEGMLGFFINLLVLRSRLSRDMTLVDLLGVVKDSALEAYAHQHLPFERLVHELSPEREFGRAPLIQVMFNLHNTPAVKFELPGLEVSAIELEGDISKMDLSLELMERDGEFLAKFTYSTELFERDTIARMARHYGNVLDQITRNPQLRISELSLLDSGERARMLVDWNATEVDRAGDLVLHQLVADQVALHPDAVAVWSEAGSFTYEQLDDRAERCARALVDRGVQPEQPVAVCMERSLEWAAWVLGILKAGAVYMPMPPQGPTGRVRVLLDDSGARIAITQKSLRYLLYGFDGEIVDGTEIASLPAGAGQRRPRASLPDSLAYIIFTSGSTGRPKGVQVSHRAICNHLLHRQEQFALSPGDRFLHKASQVFDIGIWELFGPLIAGAAVVLARPGGQRDSSYIAKLAADQRITDIHFPPFMLEAFLEQPASWACRDLRRVYCGGERMTGRLKDRVYERFPAARLVHQYGPTEAVVDATMAVVSPTDRDSQVSMGRPIANTRVYVLDRDLEPVPIGVTGELHIGGVGLARGYLAAPGHSAERFIPDPFAREPGARLYRTGDLVRWTADGRLQFVGRRDHQIKIRGYRVELGEIEAVLREHPAIVDAVVDAQDDEARNTSLIAYVVPHKNAMVDEGVVRAYLHPQMPEHMIPSAVITLDELPRTATGKVDRGALPRFDQRERQAEGYVAPRSDLERSLCDVFAAVLRIDRVGIHDDFFEVGGDSLVATLLVAQLMEQFEADVDLGRFFEEPTVAAVAAQMSSGGAAADASVIVPMRAFGNLPPLFCIHPAGGQVHVYQPLLGHLGGNMPIYGVRSRAIGDPALEYDELDQMAADYARMIREVQARGPYHLLGWSMGGVLAVAIASKLEAEDQRVAFLGLIDSYPGESLPQDVDADPLMSLALVLGDAFAQAFDALPAMERDRLREEISRLVPEDRLERAIEWGREHGCLGGGFSAEIMASLAQLAETHRRLLTSYRTPVVHAPIHIWWARDRAAVQRPDWGEHTRTEVRATMVDGDHFSIIREPCCVALADSVNEHLEAAQKAR